MSRGAAAVTAMYLRFVTPIIHPDSRVEAGFFRSSWYLYRNGCPDWILAELDREFDWFRVHLPVPPRVSRHSSGATRSTASAGSIRMRARQSAMPAIAPG